MRAGSDPAADRAMIQPEAASGDYIGGEAQRLIQTVAPMAKSAESAISTDLPGRGPTAYEQAPRNFQRLVLFHNQTNKNFQNGLESIWISSSEKFITAYLAKNPILFTFVLVISLKCYVLQTRTTQVNFDTPSWVV
jgi:hypothetical protein